jgi:hypothetical protein
MEPVLGTPGFPTRTLEIEWREYEPDRGDCAPAVLPPVNRAFYQCQQCNEQWQGRIGPITCRHCGSEYVRCLDP